MRILFERVLYVKNLLELFIIDTDHAAVGIRFVSGGFTMRRTFYNNALRLR